MLLADDGADILHRLVGGEDYSVVIVMDRPAVAARLQQAFKGDDVWVLGFDGERRRRHRDR